MILGTGEEVWVWREVESGQILKVLIIAPKSNWKYLYERVKSRLKGY